MKLTRWICMVVNAHITGITAAISDSALAAVKRLDCPRPGVGYALSLFDPNLRPQLWESEKKMVSTSIPGGIGGNCITGLGEGKYSPEGIHRRVWRIFTMLWA